MDKWITAGGYILAALIAAGSLWYNNRQRPHDTLKTLVEIHKDLPDSPARTALLAQIEHRVTDLTKSSTQSDSSIEVYFNLADRAAKRGAAYSIALTILTFASAVAGLVIPLFF